MGLPLCELAILATTGPRGAFPLAAQIAALPPFGVFHDLRWLFVYHDSWESFVWELACLLVFRTGFTAALVRSAWPAELERPHWRTALRRALVFIVAALFILSPLVLLLFATSATSLAWPWFSCMIPAGALTFLMYPWVITGKWRSLPTLAGCGWIIFEWVALTLAGAALDLTPMWAAFVLAAFFGALNGCAWQAVVRSLAGRSSPLTFRFVAPISIGVVYGALLIAIRVAMQTPLDCAATRHLVRQTFAPIVKSVSQR